MYKRSINITIKQTLFTIVFLLSSINCQASLIFINEIHYDNTGADQDEFVEIAGTAGSSLVDWSLLLYNGSSGLVYKTITISDVILDNSDNGFGFLALNIKGIQNGSTGGATNGIGDGIALLDNNDNLIQFLSYEGVFEAKNGKASGQFSRNISISQNASPIGKSLQLSGVGNNYDDFEWTLENETPGEVNTAQNIIIEPLFPVVQVSEPNLTILFSLLVIGLCLNKKRAKPLLESVS